MSCTVYIWTSSSSGSKSFGHAAMQIGDERIGSYVSWWPGGEGAGLHSLLPGVVHSSATPLSLKMDIEWEGGEKPNSYKLQTLDNLAMEKYWKSEYGCAGTHKYRLLRKNCSTIVYKTLKAGGATKLVSPPLLQWHWKPSELRSYVISLQKKEQKTSSKRSKDYISKMGKKVMV